MRWVKETLPPRARARWLLMTVRLSHNSLTGTERTDVAVGTASEASMFWAVRAGAPRSTVYVGSSLAAAGAAGLLSLATGVVVPLAGSSACPAGRGLATGAGAFSSPFGSALDSVLGWVFSAAFGSVFGWGFASVLAGAAAAGFCSVLVAPDAAWPLVLPLAWKYLTQVGSTLPGSFWYWSYISSTSHSLAPKSAEGCSGDWLPEDCGTGWFASSGVTRAVMVSVVKARPP